MSIPLISAAVERRQEEVPAWTSETDRDVEQQISMFSSSESQTSVPVVAGSQGFSPSTPIKQEQSSDDQLQFVESLPSSYNPFDFTRATAASSQSTSSATGSFASTSVQQMAVSSSTDALEESLFGATAAAAAARRRRSSIKLLPFDHSQGFSSLRLTPGLPHMWPASDPPSPEDSHIHSIANSSSTPTAILSSPSAPARREHLIQSPPFPHGHTGKLPHGVIRRHTEPLRIVTPPTHTGPGSVDPMLINQPRSAPIGNLPIVRKRTRGQSFDIPYEWNPRRRRSVDAFLDGYSLYSAMSPSDPLQSLHMHTPASMNVTNVVDVTPEDFDHDFVVPSDAANMKFQEAVSIKGEEHLVPDYNGRLTMGRLCQLVGEYLQDPSHECTIIVTQSTAAQKSYGEEKRFFTSPICRLLGGGWDLPKLQEAYANSPDALADSKVGGKNLQIRISTMPNFHTEQQPSRVPSKTENSCTTRATPSDSEYEDDEVHLPGALDKAQGILGNVKYMQERIDLLSRTSSLRDRPDARSHKTVAAAVFQKLHVGVNESRKRVPLFFQIQCPAGPLLYESKPFTKISKPSKKRQTSKAQLLIMSGSTIAIFNRTKSQTGNTRFLGVDADNMTLVPCSGMWDNWVIFAVDDPRFDPYVAPGLSPMLSAPNRGTYLDIVAIGEPQEDLVWTRPKFRSGGDLNDGSVDMDAYDDGLGFGSQVFMTPPTTPLNVKRKLARNAPVASGQDEKPPCARPIHYGDTVVLQNCSTGLVTRPLIVRKIENRTNAVIDAKVDAVEKQGTAPQEPSRRGDPISPLHKVAFQLAGHAGQFLSLSSRYGHIVVDLHHTKLSSGSSARRNRGRRHGNDNESDPDREHVQNAAALRRRKGKGKGQSPVPSNDVGETCIWTVVGTDQIECTFHIPTLTPSEIDTLDPASLPCSDCDSDIFSSSDDEDPHGSPTPREPLRTRFPLMRVHPIPTTKFITRFNPGVIALTGTNFQPNLWVFFGTHPSTKTQVETSELLLASLPGHNADVDVSLDGCVKQEQKSIYFSSTTETSYPTSPVSTPQIVPILLVRDDGVIYRTGHYYRLE
ncbi:uncharacterized protein SPPG_08931 [Spizellomyces punctatus DAOM BR117]|uniref:Uncharacterized protein n=1 Tax=Spizellomyces punctatus (strain DAOM BR117) TaxID=645134 RepID=A0A0L0HRF4_SPIPD|nr:uncharacterized protein SPPG_08931 [Spizellomyces punctatus DAOM BR117]KND03956.1 hypothetical protein SPPG_08931 [Spizellomyces punctatus DAOM BR117]|eukprot:XP_016611995.1 hypothetical protein SPPG_08931 [Spizellomyces punctatus DAOM BR117]